MEEMEERVKLAVNLFRELSTGTASIVSMPLLVKAAGW